MNKNQELLNKMLCPHVKEGSLHLTLYNGQKSTQNGLRPKCKTNTSREKKQEENFMTLDLAVSSWIWPQKHRQQQKKLNGNTLKLIHFCVTREQYSENTTYGMGKTITKISKDLSKDLSLLKG